MDLVFNWNRCIQWLRMKLVRTMEGRTTSLAIPTGHPCSLPRIRIRYPGTRLDLLGRNNRRPHTAHQNRIGSEKSLFPMLPHGLFTQKVRPRRRRRPETTSHRRVPEALYLPRLLSHTMFRLGRMLRGICLFRISILSTGILLSRSFISPRHRRSLSPVQLRHQNPLLYQCHSKTRASSVLRNRKGRLRKKLDLLQRQVREQSFSRRSRAILLVCLLRCHPPLRVSVCQHQVQRALSGSIGSGRTSQIRLVRSRQALRAQQ